MKTTGGEPFVVTVKVKDEASVTLDANHPLAGKDLTFQLSWSRCFSERPGPHAVVGVWRFALVVRPSCFGS
jgi:hypothetical protein